MGGTGSYHGEIGGWEVLVGWCSVCMGVLDCCWCRCASGGSYWVVLKWIWGSRRSSLGVVFCRLARNGGRDCGFFLVSLYFNEQQKRTLSRCRLSWSSWDRSISSRCMCPFPNTNNVRLLWLPDWSVTITSNGMKLTSSPSYFLVQSRQA